MYFIFCLVALTFRVDGSCACMIWQVWNIWMEAGRELKKYMCVGGIWWEEVCVCVCELGTSCLWSSVATRTLRPDKRPTSYGNSNSVQVFSASTFAAQRAVDWPGEQPGPQRRLSELQSVKTNAWCPHSLLFLNHRPCRNTRVPSSVRPSRGDPQHNLRPGTGTGMSLPRHQPEQVGGEDRPRLKMSTSELVALAAPRLEMWLGAVRQWEVLKTAWRWKYSRVGWSGKSLLHSERAWPLKKTAARGSRNCFAPDLTHLVPQMYHSGLQTVSKFNSRDGRNRPMCLLMQHVIPENQPKKETQRYNLSFGGSCNKGHTPVRVLIGH